MRDLVRNLLNRLGTVGVILLASALLFVVLASAVIVHRLDTAPTVSNESAQGDKTGEQTGRQTKPLKNKHANQDPSTSQQSDGPEDKDA